MIIGFLFGFFSLSLSHISVPDVGLRMTLCGDSDDSRIGLKTKEFQKNEKVNAPNLLPARVSVIAGNFAVVLNCVINYNNHFPSHVRRCCASKGDGGRGGGRKKGESRQIKWYFTAAPIVNHFTPY